MIENYFTPQQTKSVETTEVELTLIEIEAIRLSDVECLNDKKVAKKMDLTQEEFKKLLNNARKKIGIALVDGISIKIIDKEEVKEEITTLCKFRCSICGEIYTVNYLDSEIICPLCNSTKIMTNEEAGFYK
ncbi:MAG: DUF134 domain-containing protein [Romboutsia sp.]|uniref:DUF134 domain-containing protein n=1 Tax=Romboutsia sp. TaxID=1965302 RepID=UPI003F3D8DB6